MKKNADLKNSKKGIIEASLFAFILLIFSFSFEIKAQTVTNDPTEKKVDYLERIYFSGRDKNGLQAIIMTSKQEIEAKTPTKALATQLTFLMEIESKAAAADDACELLEMIAAGVYHIDAIEADAQGIKLPSEKAKAKAGDALATLNQLGSSSAALSNSATSLGWSNYLLSGNAKSLATAGKIAGTANTVNVASSAIGQTVQTGKQLGDLAKGLGIGKKKDKPCKSVQQKDIAIGEHAGTLPTTNSNNAVSQSPVPSVAEVGTTLLVRNIQFDQIDAFVTNVKNIKGVSTVNQSNFDNGIITLQITHGMQTGELVKKILDANAKMKLKVEGFTANQATLTIAK